VGPSPTGDSRHRGARSFARFIFEGDAFSGLVVEILHAGYGAVEKAGAAGFKRTDGEDLADDGGNVPRVSSEGLGIEAKGAAELERCESELRDERDGERAPRIHRFEEVADLGAEGLFFFDNEDMEPGVAAVPAGGLALGWGDRALEKARGLGAAGCVRDAAGADMNVGSSRT
jgi:hypothetical protein